MKSGISFQDLARLQSELLSKQSPATLEEMRAQALLINFKHTEEDSRYGVKYNLKMYFPDWTQKQIEDGFNEIKTIITTQRVFEKAKHEISEYLTRSKNK